MAAASGVRGCFLLAVLEAPFSCLRSPTCLPFSSWFCGAVADWKSCVNRYCRPRSSFHH